MKNNLSVFLVFPKICKKINKKNVFLAYFGPLKANYRLFLGLLTFHCFSLTLITFFVCIIPYIYICFYYFLILCFYFNLLFLTLLTTKYVLQFTMFHAISLQAARNIKEIKKYFISTSLLTYFLFSFCSDYRLKIFFSYHILTNILSTNYYTILFIF